ncbi:MAG: glycoside hydrolase family 3 C-terminal domain-containing protein [Clostridia bacterium]|nr:glycoside hydrolase family 3 C-terminal domain-containing protein [Clostridia bacterium]
MKITKFGKPALWRTIAAVSGVILCLAIGGSAVTTEWSGYINKYLGISNTKIVTSEDSEEDPIHYHSDYDNYTDVMNYARGVAKEAQAEGTVLMTNKNNALPLAKNSKVTFFGYNSIDPALGGTGSGGVTASDERKIDLYEACANKLDYNTTMYNFYKNKYDAQEGFTSVTNEYTGVTTQSFQVVNGVTELNSSAFSATEESSWQEYGDAAIFVMTRIGGEGTDLSPDANYLELSENEKSVLQTMKTQKQNGVFSKLIVLVNTFNAPELGWLDDYDIDACLYIGGPGEVGLDAVTDILVGDTNPSGHLADTYAYSSMSSPAMQNFGDYTFSNSSDVVNSDASHYVMYNEGIYVGYRYYETRYEDTVLNKGNASSTAGVYENEGNWSYKDEVQFPFGLGLSYTTFTQTLDSVKVDWTDKTATVKVTVENTGDKAGKDVVQVYAQSPYYFEDGTTSSVEKSAVQLCGFAKTDELSANGGKQDITITIDLSDIASYDYETYKTYIMEAGDYYFAIGDSAHDALNNILALKGYSTTDGMDKNGDSSKAAKETKKDFDETEYCLSYNGTKVTNQFDSANLNYYSDTSSDIVTYLTRSNWSGTWPEEMKNFAATSKMKEIIASYYTSDTSGSTSPSAYEKGETTSDIVMGAENGLTLATFIGADYDDDNWDLLLDQLTEDDYLATTKQAREALESVGLNATTAVDGPAAWTKSYYIENYEDQYDATKNVTTSEACVSYPTETVLAGTWNVALLEEVGNSFGEEGLWGGGCGWYGPGADTHRTPYGGRNFEYFSEDSYISGKLCEAEVHGAMAKGVVCYLKHFVMNDQETNRIGVCTFANEQAMREIYMRAFQYSFESTGEDDRSCNGVMGSFNRLGVVWSGHTGNLWHNVMEDEWGFLGIVTTDFGQLPGSLMEPELAYEAGTETFCTSGSTFSSYLQGCNFTKDSKLLGNMREAIHRILYNFANSAAMNGLTSDSVVVKIRTWYDKLLLSLEIIFGIILAAAVIMIVLQTVFGKIDEKKEKSSSDSTNQKRED